MNNGRGLLWFVVLLLITVLFGIGVLGFLLLGLRQPTPESEPDEEVIRNAVILTMEAESQMATINAPTQTPLPLPTETLLPTATQSPGPTATAYTGDPIEILGTPDGVDNFNTDNDWTLFDNECFQSEITGGQYVMTAKGLLENACWELSWPLIQDYYIETQLVMPEECSNDDRFGLFFRAPDNNRGYLFGLTCDGRYSMTSWDGEKTNIVVDLATNEIINDLPGETNRIGLVALGNEFSLYANGALLTQTTNNLFTGPGKIGYFVRASVGNRGFVSSYDSLAVWLLEE